MVFIKIEVEQKELIIYDSTYREAIEKAHKIIQERYRKKYTTIKSITEKEAHEIWNRKNT